MRLPQLVSNIQLNSQQIVQLRGINLSDSLNDGDLADSQNISARRYPYITTRKSRVKQSLSNVQSLTAWGKLVAVSGTDLLYDGEVVGEVEAGEKQFAVVNTKLVIWPDKKYLDLNEMVVKPLAATETYTGGTYTTNTLTVSGTDLTTKFNVGDCVKISGNTAEATLANNKSIVIQALTETVMTVSDDGFSEGEETAEITIDRSIPDLDYICESENRLWGCNSSDQTIYASALGDPLNFNTFEGLSTDSYTLAVGTEGEFTGCCKLSSSVLFFKETLLHKMLGSYPSEYQLYTYTQEGLRKGCYKSLQVINEVLFYMGLHGVYAYSGGTPSLISSNFGEHTFTDAVAGNDGDTYFLSCKEGDTNYFFAYESKYGIWILEDNVSAVQFARISKDLYFVDSNGDVYLEDGGEELTSSDSWSIQFTPFYETIEGRKCYSKILMRFELPEGSTVSAAVRMDGGTWTTIGTLTGSKVDVTPMRIAPNRCDKFEIKLTGTGQCTLLSMLRQFFVGSDM